MNNDIRELFSLRDEAVRNKDADQLLSTQLLELPYGSSEGYLSVDGMETEIISLQEDQGIAVAFVKESYTPSPDGKKRNRTAFLIYFLVDTSRGWRIYQIR
ncbi:hypothetical protein [Streptomyces sp. NRRL S-495]|uniref:hypothetical protein n=1 Tax=Streptomyces sp. NRRL S-495 TaxID=1609133 RepID=UPI0005F95F30|nr:hypothetical protein [Streptomyces sp. NRRL S-495]